MGKMSAILAPGGRALHWNNKDVWTRVELDGRWQEGSSKLVHTIEGGTLRAEGANWPLTLTGPNAFKLDLNGTQMSATLDRLCQRLSWNDGDVWCRLNYEASKS